MERDRIEKEMSPFSTDLAVVIKKEGVRQRRSYTRIHTFYICT